MRPVRSALVTVATSLVVGLLGSVPNSFAQEAQLEPNSEQPLLEQPLSGQSMATPRDASLGGPRLQEDGIVVDLSGGAAKLPKVRARTWVIADATTGEVLAAKHAHRPRRPASTIKTLTALTLLPKLNPEDTWVGTAKAQNTIGSKAGIRAGQEYTIDELFYGLMLPSGNDAAIALAQVYSTEGATVEAMNEVARNLQARNTTARNTSGLDAPGQFSTAYDLTLIARAALKREDFRKYAGAKTAEFPNPRKKRKKPINIYNQNRLVMRDYRGAVGVKTGFTSKAGRTFIAAAERDGRLLIVSLMGVRERSDQAARKLLNWGFRNRENIVPVGTLTEPVPETTVSDAITVSREVSTESANVEPAVSVASPQTQSLSSLSPTAWGWLAVFAAALLLALVTVTRRLFARRRST